MQLNTLIKIGSLAMNVLQHAPVKELSGLIGKGIHRRMQARPKENIPPAWHHPIPPYPPGAHPQSHPFPHPLYGHVPPARRNTGQAKPGQPAGGPLHPREFLKYLTPENANKLMQWHGVIQEFSKIIKPKS
jgi:hypothetical protein